MISYYDYDVDIESEGEELAKKVDRRLAYIEGIGDGEDITYCPPKTITSLSQETYEKLGHEIDEIVNDICRLIHMGPETDVIIGGPAQ